MAVVITGEYLGEKRVRVIHQESGSEIVTDAPKDNHGLGANFSPTDLVAAGLGACILTTMAIVAERSGIDLSKMKMRVEKHMSTTPPRRIASIPLIINLPSSLSPDERLKLERAAATCPVHHSLHPDTKVELTFIYDCDS